MTPVDRFDKWCQEHPEELLRIQKQAVEFGLTDAEVSRQLSGMRWWLAQNEGSPKANKRAWGRFITNWLRNSTTRRGGQHGRRNPTASTRKTGTYEL